MRWHSSSSIKRATTCVSLVTMMHSANLWAISDDELFSLSLNELLTTTITSVSRSEETLRTSASAIYIINKHQLDSLNITDLKELLHYMPSIEYGYGHSWLQGGMRGFSDNWSKVKLLIDGETIDLLGTGEAFIGHQFSLHNIARVEIIPGGASFVYGADAYAGVINLVTQDSYEEEIKISAEIADQDYESRKWNINLGGDLSLFKWKSSFFYLTKHDADFSDFVSSEDFSEPNRDFRNQLLNSGNYPYRDKNKAYAFDLSLESEISSEHSLSFSYIKLYDRDGGGMESPEMSFRDFRTERDQDKLSLSYRFKPAQSPWDSNLNLRYRQEDEINRSNTREPINGQLSPLYSFDSLGSNETQINWVSLYKRAAKGSEIQIGGGYMDRDLTRPFYEADPLLELNPFLKQDNWYAFANYETKQYWEISQFVFGVRKDDNSLYESPPVYKIGMINRVSSNWTSKLLYSESFRTPTLFELEINPELDPSLMKTYEWANIFTPDSNWIIQGSLYSNQAYDLIVTKQVADDGQNLELFKTVNEDEKIIHGAEVLGTRYFDDGFITAWISQTQFKNQADVAKTKFGLLANTHLTHRITTGLSVKYTDEIDTPYKDVNFEEQTLTVPEYVNIDVNLNYNPSLFPGSIWFKVRNALDEEQYFPNVRGEDPKQFMTLGRQFEIGIQSAF